MRTFIFTIMLVFVLVACAGPSNFTIRTTEKVAGKIVKETVCRVEGDLSLLPL